MGVNVLKNCKCYLSGYDLSGDMNQLELKVENDKLDATTFGSETKHYAAGLKDVSFSHAGLITLGTGAVEDRLRTEWGVVDGIMTLCAQTGADGEEAEALKSLLAAYTPSGKVGELFGFAMEGGASNSNMVRGTIMAAGAKTSTANGTIRQLGAVGATQKLYAIMQVLAVSGTNPTLDVVVASDDAAGFASGLTKATFAQKTAVGAEWIEVSGAITDDYWRVGWTIGGTDTPSFTVAVVLAIL